ncbi:MAG: hypothetical protein DME58_01610 [Verrucomicrobia bacterium]|nr:MAG: hypothetical protein DME58_01610 [Verrucomicrobiota bacterium]
MSSFEPCRFNTYFHAICATAIALAFVVSGQTVLAVDGDLDPTFGTDGKVLTDFDHSTDIAYAVAVQTDGKLVVVGTTYRDNDFSNEDFAVARYNPDGTLDKTFGVGGKVQTDFPGLAAVASSVVVQPDGKIVVAGGAFPLFTFLGDFKVVRYNSNGALDTSFGDSGIVTTTFPEGSYAFDVALQADGKIIAAGTVFVDFNPGESSNTDFALARYNPDGSASTRWQDCRCWIRYLPKRRSPEFRCRALYFKRRTRHQLRYRRNDADRLRQLLPGCCQSPAAKQWQNHHRRRFERRVIRGRLFVGSADSDRCARSRLWRWRQSTNFLWRSKRRSQRRRFSARWKDCGCRFPSDGP